jgi:hypothetical protein
MKTTNTQKKIGSIAIAMLCAFFVNGVHVAFAESATPTGTDSGSFAVQPAKIELDLAPGDSATKTIDIANNTGSDATFTLDVEDISGTDSGSDTVEFFGTTTGPYSVKSIIALPKESVMVPNGGEIEVPITLTMPQNAEPGGKYGAVFVKETPSDANGASVSARIGVLFFIRTSGDTTAKAGLKKFGTANGADFFGTGDVPLAITVQNTGNVHVNPYGYITVKNMLGSVVATIPLDPWFVLPNSVRTREVEWKSANAFGIYRAILSLNRGYNNTVDSRSISFVVIPWWFFPSALIILAGIAWFIRSRYQEKRRTSANSKAV